MKQEQAFQLYDYEMEPEEVMQASLDALLSQQSVRMPEVNSLRLIKIDVEGMEAQVLLCLLREDVINKVINAVVCESRRGPDSGYTSPDSGYT